MDRRFGDRIPGTIFGYIISFIMSILLFTLVSVIILQNTVLNSNFMSSAIKESDYSKLLTTEINAQFNNLAKISGVPVSIFKNIITEDTVKTDTVNYFSESMRGVGYVTDTTSLKSILKSNLSQYIKTVDTNTISEDELNKNINSFIAKAGVIYTSNVDINYIAEFGKISNIFNSVAPLALVVLSILTLIFLGLLLLIFAGRKRRALIIYSLTATSIMLLALPIYAALTGLVARISTDTKSLYTLFTEILYRFMNAFLIFGLSLLVIVAILIVLNVFMSKKNS